MVEKERFWEWENLITSGFVQLSWSDEVDLMAISVFPVGKFNLH